MIFTKPIAIANRLPKATAIWITLALAVSNLIGCRESAPERAIVSGTVSHNGQPVPHGIIRFVPSSSSPGPTIAATILNGLYRADGRGGVQVGSHSVQIEAYRIVASSRKSDGNSPLPPSVAETGSERIQWLPPKYNSDTQLEVTIDSESPEIVKNFDLKD